MGVNKTLHTAKLPIGQLVLHQSGTNQARASNVYWGGTGALVLLILRRGPRCGSVSELSVYETPGSSNNQSGGGCLCAHSTTGRHRHRHRHHHCHTPPPHNNSTFNCRNICHNAIRSSSPTEPPAHTRTNTYTPTYTYTHACTHLCVKFCLCSSSSKHVPFLVLFKTRVRAQQALLPSLAAAQLLLP